MPAFNWDQLNRLETPALKGALFSLFQELAEKIQVAEPDDPALLSTVPRLADLLSTKPEISDFTEMFSTLARSVGLWNYIDKQDADVRDRIIAEAVTIKELDGVTLHREQIAALNILLCGRNLILSAPTSFGESLLIDALLLSGHYSRVAIVLPTLGSVRA